MTVRLWTSGWDFFAPGANIIYHLWERTHRPNFRCAVFTPFLIVDEYRENQTVSEVEENSRNRVRYILGTRAKDSVSEDCLIEIEKYGIRQDAPRTVVEYEEASGVSFSTRNINEKAKYGGLSKEAFMEETMDAILRLVASLNASNTS